MIIVVKTKTKTVFNFLSREGKNMVLPQYCLEKRDFIMRGISKNSIEPQRDKEKLGGRPERKGTVFAKI
jgi:hypothetical protein